MKTALSRILPAALLACAVLVEPSAAADAFPSRPVRIIVATAGGVNDVFARVVAPRLAEALGQPVVVEPKPGAGGTIATDYVAKSAPDGYTLLIGFTGPLAINVTLIDKLPYDPVKDFAPITLVGDAAQLLVAHSSVPVTSVLELIAYAKAHPGKLSYASIAVGSAGHLTMEKFKAATGINLVHVPYKGASPAVTDLLAGNVQVAFLVVSNVLPSVKSGRLKALAVAGRARIVSIPGVPTMAELGFPEFEIGAWLGILAPAGTAKPIIDRYHREFVRILKDPEVRARFEPAGFELTESTPEEFGNFIRAEITKWGKVVKLIGARAD